ncbi:MAG: hypothetical protein EOP46_10355 [Sphingobacteriaceae bacterium]|nr:MAG: hypothetical protein EOP46_10355 [Sphingobacteriaceae bacterium]
MKTQDLNNKELREINGGGLLGGDDSSNNGSLGAVLGVDNLISTSSSTRDGDESSKSKFSAGNGITLDLGGIFKNITG